MQNQFFQNLIIQTYRFAGHYFKFFDAFENNKFQPANVFTKKLHHRCLTKCTRPSAYQGVRNVSFSGDLACFVFL